MLPLLWSSNYNSSLVTFEIVNGHLRGFATFRLVNPLFPATSWETTSNRERRDTPCTHTCLRWYAHLLPALVSTDINDALFPKTAGRGD